VLNDSYRAGGLANEGACFLSAQAADDSQQENLGMTRRQPGKELGDCGVGDPDVFGLMALSQA
jgi:hypothetical protein